MTLFCPFPWFPLYLFTRALKSALVLSQEAYHVHVIHSSYIKQPPVIHYSAHLTFNFSSMKLSMCLDRFFFFALITHMKWLVYNVVILTGISLTSDYLNELFSGRNHVGLCFPCISFETMVALTIFDVCFLFMSLPTTSLLPVYLILLTYVFCWHWQTIHFYNYSAI